MLRLFIVLSLTVSYLSGQAQFNMGAGYSLSYINPKIDRGIIKQFNADRPWLEQELDPIRFLQGISLNVRYRWDFIGFELGWHNRFRLDRSEGIDPSTEATFQRRVNHQLISYSAGIEYFVENFSYGGSLNLDHFTIKTEVTGIDEKFKLINEYGLGSHFFIAYNIDGTDGLGVSIRPYVQIPWTRYNLAPLNLELNGDDSLENRDENYMNFGIQFVFYNGQYKERG